MHAVIPEADLGLRRHQLLHRTRHQHLAGARFCGDAGADVEGEADRLSAAHGVFAGMQADPDLEAERTHGLLDRGRAIDSGGRRLERRQHAVARGRDFLAARALQLLADRRVIMTHDLGPADIAELCGFCGGADDIDDQDRGKRSLEFGVARGRSAPEHDRADERFITMIAAPRDRGLCVVLGPLRAAAANGLLLRQTGPVDLSSVTGALDLHGTPFQDDRRADAPDAPRLRRVTRYVRLMDADAEEFWHERAADRSNVWATQGQA